MGRRFGLVAEVFGARAKSLALVVTASRIFAEFGPLLRNKIGHKCDGQLD